MLVCTQQNEINLLFLILNLKIPNYIVWLMLIVILPLYGYCCSKEIVWEVNFYSKFSSIKL